MVANKHITKIVVAVMATAVVLCLLAMAFSDRLTQALGGTGVRKEYEYKLFDTDELISIDILMDEDSWNKMLANATSEEYYVCSVVINGTRLDNVAIRPKGNTSLSAIAMDANSDRFSFKLEFDHFVEGQTCFGLDKLILNNNYADATWMKEALVYDMYRYLGADASLYNYAKISVNGEYWGVYLALEAVEQSFMLRNYGTQDGELYKPDSMGMGGGGDKKSGSSMPDAGSFDPGSKPDMGSFDMSSLPDMGSFDPGSMPDMDSFDMSSLPDMGSFDPGSTPDTGSSAQGGAPDSESGGSADARTAEAPGPPAASHSAAASPAAAEQISIIPTTNWTATAPSGTARSPKPARTITAASSPR